MPLIAALRHRLGYTGQLVALCSALLVVVGALVLAWSAQSTSLASARKAAATAHCINRVLAARNDPVQTDRKASATFAASLTNYLSAAVSAKTRTEKLAAFERFRTDSAAWKAALQADVTATQKHPFGHC